MTIMTKYHSPTDTRGARISAVASTTRLGRHTRITIGYPHELSGSEVHAAAARALVVKLGMDPSLLISITDICNGVGWFTVNG
jgi:hypothetical protein